ncbi:hypothetical protein CUROG_03980 [Corynebacterium urogenitale]|uniref:Uncharacterized protein n=1 Tax=Corynebacterium urogenitale TaxID=2487892 RepID=A0A5J6Z912_9CORY|nr:hypothetical protein CUROG_03980 [Corynebacterium urogenitale]
MGNADCIELERSPAHHGDLIKHSLRRVLVGTYQSARAEFHTPEVAHHDHGNVLNFGTTQDLQHGLTRRASWFPIIARAFNRLGIIHVHNERSAVVTSIRIPRSHVVNKLPRLFLRCGSSGDANEVGAFNLNFGRPFVIGREEIAGLIH